MRGHAAITFRDSEAPGSNSSSPWLYIQSEARQDIAFHPAPSRSARVSIMGPGQERGACSTDHDWINLAQQNAELMVRLAAVDAIGPLGWRP